MAGVKEVMKDVVGWLRALIDLGMSLVLVFLLIDILFPGLDLVLGNINSIVASFADRGVAGIIALLLFVLIYKK